MSLPTEQHFILKEDGKIYWIEKMPEKINTEGAPVGPFWVQSYESDLQSAIDCAIEVSNQDETIAAVFASDGLPKDDHTRKAWRINAIHSLLCSVEKKFQFMYTGMEYWTDCHASVYHEYQLKDAYGAKSRIVAIVTFSQPEKETQDELWFEAFTECPMRVHPSSEKFLKDHYTLTRKEK